MSHSYKSLQSIAKNSLYAAGASGAMVRYSYKVFSRHLRPGEILEFGPAEGVMTDLFVKARKRVTVVEGAKKFCDELRERYKKKITVYHSMIEDFRTNRKYENIVLGHVLEHVDDPVGVLRHVRRFLKKRGVLIAAVPNAHSIHRQAAVKMGILKREDSLNELDIHHGHQRVYLPETFKRDFQRAGYSIRKFGGYWLKPLSNKQIDQYWTPDMLEAFMELGEAYPEIAGDIYIVAQLEK